MEEQAWMLLMEASQINRRPTITLFSHRQQSRMHRLDALQIFVRVAEMGSFTKAALLLARPRPPPRSRCGS
ncbi:hypothetical protein ACFX58_08290 [Sphingomonas sp. NCPPB 2930]